MKTIFDFGEQYEKYYPVITGYAENKEEEIITLVSDYPIILTDINGVRKKIRYHDTQRQGGLFLGYASAQDCLGNTFHITDIWSKQSEGYKVDRKVECTEFARETGIRLTTEFRMKGKCEESFSDYQFIIPGAFYHNNDTDQDGLEDYLGTYEQDIKDDRNPQLSVTSFAAKSQVYMSLIRADVPIKDTTIDRDKINRRHFVHDTDIGSLGFSPSEYRQNECILRCDYPFYERNTFCLNIDGSEWSAYKKIETGTSFSMSYMILLGTAENLTGASWQTTELQMNRILKEKVELPFSMRDAQKYRREMIHNSFKEFPDKKGKPAGYFVHFSPRQKYGSQNLLEYGFTGAQTLLAYDMLTAAWEGCDELPQCREHSLKTLDYFVENRVNIHGLPDGIYNVDKEEVVYWWTGILFPFQYSRDRKKLEEYLGNQIVGALISVAEELSKVKGNYCRSMIDTMYYLMKSYLIEKEKGYDHKNWFECMITFADQLLNMQNKNGSWNRGFSVDGKPLTNPPQWFGKTELEQSSGAIFPIPFLVDVYHLTGDIKYFTSAKRAADYIMDHYVKNVYYIGGINDTSHKKSVKMDAASVMFAMRSLLSVYKETLDKKYISGALDAAKILATWTFLWDVPFDKTTLLGEHQFQTTGWAVCDVIPAGSYVDCSFMEVIPELFEIAAICKEPKLKWLAEIVVRGMQNGLSTPEDMYGYAMRGVQCEGYMTSLWLADTEYKEFSGAAAKNKGDDNDTCNGFVNGMALLALDYMENH